jgi:hypothetical protein
VHRLGRRPRARKRTADLAVAGRTRWAVYDPVADVFHVNVADPPQIVVVEAGEAFSVPERRPIRPQSSCGCPRCHEKSKLDTEHGHIVVPHELMQALNVTAAPSARQALATDCEL